MGWIGIFFWLLPRRLRSSWALLTIISFGVLMAVTLMAVGAVYSRALAEGGLRHNLAAASFLVLNTQIVVQNRPLGPGDYQKLRTSVEELTDRYLGFMLRDTQRYGRLQPALPAVTSPTENTSLTGAPLGRPFFLTDFPEHTRLLEGDWPRSTPPSGDDELALQVAVGRITAISMAWEVGTRAYIFPFRGDLSERIAIDIVGLVEPLDPSEEYWMGTPSYFTPQQQGDTYLLPLYVTEDIYFNELGARYPALGGDYGWYLYLNTGVLTADLVQPTREAFYSLETEINKQVPRSLVFTGLENSRGTGLLAIYQQDLALARVPIYLFLSLVIVVILYFLSLVTGLLTQTRSEEASFFRSRGASPLQVLGLLTLGEGVVVILAAVVGPFLGLLVVRLLLLGTINPEGSTAPFSVGLAPDMFILGAIGGLLSLTVLIGSSFNLSRLGLVEFFRDRARPPTVPLLQRYYIDALIVGLLALVWWQVQSRGGFVEQELADRALHIDPSMLAVPVLALVTAAFLVMRLLPLLARGLSWLASQRAPAWAAFALARVARDPLPYASLTVIVMMAAALGTFGAAFQTTLSRSQQEQVLYAQGGDLVVAGISPFMAERIEEERALESIPGVQTVSPLRRDSVNILELPRGNTTLLAVDPVTLPDAAWFREDFSPQGQPLSELLTPLRRGHRIAGQSNQPASGVPIPEDAQRVGVWVNSTQVGQSIVRAALDLWLRLGDSGGRYWDLKLGTIQIGGTTSGAAASTDGWVYLESDLPPEQSGTRPPFGLVSISVTGQSVNRMPPGTLRLDDITARPGASNSPEGTIIESFDQIGRWVPLIHDGDEPDIAEIAPSAARSGNSGLAFSWTDPIVNRQRGILIPPGPYPLPAIGSPELPVGQQLRLVSGPVFLPLLVQGNADFFPTANPTSAPFVLVSLESYDEFAHRLFAGNAQPPNEYWVTLGENADREGVIAALEELLPPAASVQDREARLDRARRNPLAGGGWNGLTLLGLFVLAGAVALALGTHAAVAVRSGRVDLTVARALGFSRLQLMGSLALERVVVSGAGVIIGVVIGLGLGWWVLGYLDQTASGREVIPPMLLAVQQWIIGLAILSLVASALLAILLATVSANRLRPSDILRAGE